MMKSMMLIPLAIPPFVAWTRNRELRWRWILAGQLLLVTVVYPLVGTMRSIYCIGRGPSRVQALISSVNRIADDGLYWDRSPLEYAQDALWRVGGIGSIMQVLDLDRRGQLDIDGEFYLRSLVGLVPRWLWPDKPIIHEGSYFNSYLQGKTGISQIDTTEITSSTAITLFGSFYWNLKWPGLIISSWVLGILSAFGYGLLKDSLSFESRIVYYFALLPVLSTAENEVVTFLSALVIQLMMAWLINLLMADRTNRTATQADTHPLSPPHLGLRSANRPPVLGIPH
jgi:hypothetical protein